MTRKSLKNMKRKLKNGEIFTDNTANSRLISTVFKKLTC